VYGNEDDLLAADLEPTLEQLGSDSVLYAIL